MQPGLVVAGQWPTAFFGDATRNNRRFLWCRHGDVAAVVFLQPLQVFAQHLRNILSRLGGADVKLRGCFALVLNINLVLFIPGLCVGTFTQGDVIKAQMLPARQSLIKMIFILDGLTSPFFLCVCNQKNALDRGRNNRVIRVISRGNAPNPAG